MTKHKRRKSHGWNVGRGAKVGLKALILSIPAMIVSWIIGIPLSLVLGAAAMPIEFVIGFTIFGMFLWRFWNWVKKDSWI